MKEVLVVANRTLGGAKLLEAVRARAAAGRRPLPPGRAAEQALRRARDLRRGGPRIGAGARRPRALGGRRRGHRGHRRSRRPRPVPRRRWTRSPRADPTRSSSPPTPPRSSGWLRRDLIERIENASGLPVEHIVIDLEQEGLPFKVTLVVANKTSSGEELLEHLKRQGRATASSTCSSPSCRSSDGSGGAPREARARLATHARPPAARPACSARA